MDLFKTAIPLVSTSEKAWGTNTDALSWLKENISKSNAGQATLDQSFMYGERKDYFASFNVRKTDQKGVATEEKYELSILDINRNNLAVKVSGIQLAVSVETNGNKSYIKYIKNSELQSYANEFEIVTDDVDQARNIIAAFSTAIDKSKMVIPDFGTLQKSLDFITKNTSDLTLEKKDSETGNQFHPGEWDQIFIYLCRTGFQREID